MTNCIKDIKFQILISGLKFLWLIKNIEFKIEIKIEFIYFFW